MISPAQMAYQRTTLSDCSGTMYDHAAQRRLADPRDPNPNPGPFPGKPVPTSDGEAF
jgi:hypothetical protein